jgi:hypothetical protein
VDAEIGAEVAEVRVVGDVKTRKKNGFLSQNLAVL